jgi:hypothetical protein
VFEVKKLVDPCLDRCNSSRSRPAAEKDNGFQGLRYRYRHTFWHLCRWFARLGSWDACGAVSMHFPWQFICRQFPSLENRTTSWIEFQDWTPEHAVAAQLATEAKSAVTWIKVLISYHNRFWYEPALYIGENIISLVRLADIIAGFGLIGTLIVEPLVAG